MKLKGNFGTIAISFLLISEFYFGTLLSSKFLEPIAILLILIFDRSFYIKKWDLTFYILFTLLLIVGNFFSPIDIYILSSEFLKYFYSFLIFFAIKSFNHSRVKELFHNIYLLSGFFIFLLISKAIYKGYFNHTILDFSSAFFDYDFSLPSLLLPVFISNKDYFKGTKVLRILTISLVIIVTFLSHWRAIQIGLLFYFLIRFLKSRYLRNWILIFSSLAIILVYNKFYAPLPNNTQVPDLSTGRFYLWTKTMYVYDIDYNFLEKLFGKGLGSFPSAINAVYLPPVDISLDKLELTSVNLKDIDSRVHAHNPIFNLIIEHGLIGVMLYLLFYFQMFKRFRNKKNGSLESYSALIVAGIFTSITYLNAYQFWFYKGLSESENYDS